MQLPKLFSTEQHSHHSLQDLVPYYARVQYQSERISTRLPASIVLTRE